MNYQPCCIKKQSMIDSSLELLQRGCLFQPHLLVQSSLDLTFIWAMPDFSTIVKVVFKFLGILGVVSFWCNTGDLTFLVDNLQANFNKICSRLNNILYFSVSIVFLNPQMNYQFLQVHLFVFVLEIVLKISPHGFSIMAASWKDLLNFILFACISWSRTWSSCTCTWLITV